MQDSNDSISVVRIRICSMVTGIFLFASPIYAQQYQRLPDSLNVGDTAVSNAMEAPADKITDTVTANSAGNEAIDWADTVSFRTIPDSLNVQIKRNKLNAYANDPAYWMKDREVDENDFWQNFQKRYSPIILKGLLYFVLPAILIFALYKIFQNKSYVFYSRPKDQLTESESELDIQQINFDEKISEAIQANDYRMAVRYMYLKTLKLVDEKGIIKFRINGTNQNYLDQMAMHPGVKEFRFLTNSYEYAWYGEFPLSLAQFEQLRSSFDHYSKQF